MSFNKKGLGRGLDALFSSSITDIIDDDQQNSSISILNLSDIKPNKDQPRKNFDDNLLHELAQSIKEYGILQPILVKPLKNGYYQIIAGERRWRAAKIAGLQQVPAIVKNLKDIESTQIALIENIQRENLNVIEEALSYQFLITHYHMSQDEIASKVGKSRPSITNTLRLLNLPKSVIELIKDNKLSAGHARALLTLNDSVKIEQKASEIIKNNLSVRDVEQSIKLDKLNSTPTNPENPEPEKNIFNHESNLLIKSFQNNLTDDIKKLIKLKHKNNNNLIEIKFNNKQDLINLIDKIKSALQ